MKETIKTTTSNVPADPVLMDDNEDQALLATITLPGYNEVSEQQVLRSVKDIFKGFEHDGSTAGGKFSDTDSLAQYMQHTMEDIRKVRLASEANQMCHKAAVMARFWYLGETIDNALVNGDYGTAAVNKLAAALMKSVPYIYQIRVVATKLTVVDCYLLGLRGLDSTHLRKLAQVKDDAVRRSIIDAFVEVFQDTSDPAKIDNAKKRLVAAINSQQVANAIDVEITDPFHGGTEVRVSEEYHAALCAMETWQKILKKAAQEESIESLCSVMADFYLPSSTPDAEARLEEFKAEAEKTKALMLSVRNNLDDAIEALDSASATGVV